MLARSFLFNGGLLRKGSAALFSLLAVGALFASSTSCSLGNIAQDDCTSHEQCASLFGAGSSCVEGYCTDPPGCVTGHDCRKTAGGGACVDGRCVTEIPKDPACQQIVEPENLLDSPLVGPDAPLIIGGIFSLVDQKDETLATSIRLAVREINAKDGLNNGKRLGVVFCDNGGPGNMASGDERIPLNNHALDYLAGTLGAPVILGPLSSADSIRLVTRLKERQYPSVIISPSATSPDLSGIDDRLSPTDPYGMFWRTCPSDELQGKVLAQNVISPDTTISKVAVAYIRDAYGEGLSTVFRSTYGLNASEGFPIYEADIFDPAKADKLAQDVNAYAPDAVLVVTVSAQQGVALMTSMSKIAGLQTKKYFFTDGSKDALLLDPNLSAELKTMLNGAKGTAPASPSGTNYDLFKTNLNADFGLDASAYSFLAQAYDATYVGAYGIVYASRNGPNYDGRDVVDGLSRLSAGTAIDLIPIDWLTGKNEIISQGQINVEGTSGHLDFDPQKGEAPGRMEIWSVDMMTMSLKTLQVVDP